MKQRNPMDHGLTNVVIRKLKSDVKQGRITDHNTIDQTIDSMIATLGNARFELGELLDITLNCDHAEHHTPYYYVKRQLMGDYVTEYNRTCKQCGHTETVSGDTDLPEWTKDAQKHYWNNNI